MKLAFGSSGFFIQFEENRIEQLIIENAECFRDILMTMVRQCEGKDGELVLSKNDMILDFQKNAVVIIDLLDLDSNQKKILNRLYEYLKKEIFENGIYMEFQELSSSILNFAGRLEEISDYPVQFDSDIDITALFKFVNIKIAEEEQPYPEKLCAHLKLLADLLNIRLIVLVNLRSYLSQEEAMEFYRMMNYCKIHLLLLESSEHPVLEYEHRHIIDSDLCLI